MAAIVLAAGASTRLEGAFKLLLPYGPRTVVESVVRSALGAGLEPVLVVVGHRAAEVRGALADGPARPLINPRWQRGQGGSLAAGVEAAAADPRVSAAVVLLGDEPGVTAAAVDAVVAAWRESGPPACRARYRDRPGHPVLFDRSLFPRLTGLRGPDAGSAVLRELGADVIEVPIDAPAPVDVDTRESYEAALEARARSSSGPGCA